MAQEDVVKLLVVAPQPFFTPRGTPFSVYYRTLVTAELGIEVDLLTYGEGQDVEIPGVRIIRIPRFAILGNVKTGPSLLKLFLDVFLVMWTVALLISQRYRIVHAHEEAVFFCRFLKPLFGFKLIYDMHSSLPQQLRNFDFTRSRWIIDLFEALEQSCLRAADAVITICPELADQVKPLIENAEKHHLIENSIFDPVRLAAGSQSANSAPSRVDLGALEAQGPLVVYAGTLEPYQGIDILLEGFAIALEQTPTLALAIAGGSPEQVDHYRERAREIGIAQRCRLTGRISQQAAKDLMRRAAVLVSPRTTGNNTPLKVYELLASGTPMVATDISSHTQVLSDDVAFLVPPSAAGIARGILAAAASSEDPATRSENARRLYRENYSREIYTAKMRTLFDRLSCAE